MRETTVMIRRTQEVKAPPDQVWSFLSSPAIWSLRPASFAFDAVSHDRTERLRVVLGTSRSGDVLADVFEIRDELPSQSLTMNLVSGPPGGELAFCFSVISGKHGTQAAITVRNRSSPWYQGATPSMWRKQLKPWLAASAAVIEGRLPPLADGLPDDMRAASMKRRTVQQMEESVSVSASVLVNAPLERAWQILWDPATNLMTDPYCVAAGRVPGTPSRQVGEVQYAIRRTRGQLHASVFPVSCLEEGRAALVHSVINGVYAETLHQVEPHENGTRLRLTACYLHPDVAARRQELEMRITALVNRYKSVIEAQNPSSGI